MGRGVLLAIAAASGVLLALAACSSFSDVPGEGGDASASETSVPDDGGKLDSPTPPKSCTDDQPFATVSPVELSLQYTYSPRLSSDELTIYVERGSLLYTAKRASLDMKFDGLVQLLVDTDGGALLGPSVQGDALGLYFFIGPYPTADIWRATRPNTGSPFGNPMSVGPGVNIGGDDIDPFVLPSGNALYFASGFSEHSLYRSALVGGVAQPAVAVAGLEFDGGSTNDQSPVLTADERTIFFASSRGTGTSSFVHIWTATRASTSDPFDPPRALSLLNGYSEQPGSISADRCRLYFARTSGTLESIFVATRTPPP